MKGLLWGSDLEKNKMIKIMKVIAITLVLLMMYQFVFSDIVRASQLLKPAGIGKKIAVWLFNQIVSEIVWNGVKWVVAWAGSLSGATLMAVCGVAGVFGAAAIFVSMLDYTTVDYVQSSDGCVYIAQTGITHCPYSYNVEEKDYLVAE